ncbi:MAG: hypothetical protein P9L99_11225 [Candidatus Lernaella stagnicola]|nr:hypothetical protein [Candidatus Lernaella stagnicola]
MADQTPISVSEVFETKCFFEKHEGRLRLFLDEENDADAVAEARVMADPCLARLMPADEGAVRERFVADCRQHLRPLASVADDQKLAEAIERVGFRYAIAAFPNLIARTPPTTLRLRLAAFMEFLAEPAAMYRILVERFRHATDSTLDDDQIISQLVELAVDLTAAEFCPRTRLHEPWERCMGGFLYLATCHEFLFRKIVDYWTEESEIVRFLRGSLQTCPSQLTEMGVQDAGHTGRIPDWAILPEKLAVRLGRERAGALERAAAQLERCVWNVAGDVLGWSDPSRLAHSVQHFWETRIDLVLSGYPYFAFHSKFATWWLSCCRNFPFYDDRQILSDQVPETRVVAPAESLRLPHIQEADAYADNEMGVEYLRMLREAIRHTRHTFFASIAAETAPTEATAHEVKRQAVDEIIAGSLAKATWPEKTSETIQRLAAKFPAIDVYETMHDVRRRLRVYVDARWNKQPTAEILAQKEIRTYRSPAILKTIATFAHCVPANHTSLWAFAVYVFLHSDIVQPQRPDRWTFKRFVREFWFWYPQELLWEAVRRGAADGVASDQWAVALLEEPAIKSLVEELQSCRTQKELDVFLTRRDFIVEKEIVENFLKKRLDVDSLDRFTSRLRACFRAWKQTRQAEGDGNVPHHLFLPLWYLTRVDQSAGDRGELMRRLGLGGGEANDGQNEIAAAQLLELLTAHLGSTKPATKAQREERH